MSETCEACKTALRLKIPLSVVKQAFFKNFVPGYKVLIKLGAI
jgi:hypothetical protein